VYLDEMRCLIRALGSMAAKMAWVFVGHADDDASL
jgi:hypothetical protein